MSRLRKLAALSAEDAALLGSAFLLVVRIRLALLTFPWPRFVAFATFAPRGRRQIATAARIAWAVSTASRFVPGATCLTQAIALRQLLAKHAHAASIHIGVALDDGRFGAHAWVECAGAQLLGNEGERARYARLFSWPVASRRPVP